jgi:hypothetical protein
MSYTSHNGPQGGNLGPGEFRAANPHLGADDKSIAFLVKYVGTEESGTVEIDTNGDVLTKDGDYGSEAAAGNALETGGTAGTIDVSDVNANELGDVIDALNANANWIAVAIDSTLGELTEAKGGSGLAFLDSGPTQAKVAKGIPVYWDTTAAWRDAVLVAPDAFRTDIRVYQDSETSVDPSFPFKGTSTKIADFDALSTYGSGTSTIKIYQEDPSVTSDRSLKATKEVYSLAGGATTVVVNKEFRTPLESERGTRLIVAIENSAAQSVVGLHVSGQLGRKLS